MEKHLVVGLMAHVDAGKTTLAEGMLYQAGTIRQLGRVDRQSTFLDPNTIEKQRGITIFDHQAELTVNDTNITLLDTPGHVDFAPTVERVLNVIDLAVLVVSAVDGIQSHTRTLWSLLRAKKIPTMIFINKLDQSGAQPDQVVTELQAEFGSQCLPFNEPNKLEDWPADTPESIAMQGDEQLLDHYLTNGKINPQDIRALVQSQKVVPIYFGAALNQMGIQELLAGIIKWGSPFTSKKSFGARVFKISHESNGTRLTWLRVTGSELKVKTTLNNEKVDQIRHYNGRQYEVKQVAKTGEIVTIAGPQKTFPGQGIGAEKQVGQATLRPVLNYAVKADDDHDFQTLRNACEQLADEEPLLHLTVNQELNQITLQLMGTVQVEVIEALLQSRFGLTVTLKPAGIVYRETINQAVEGVGHFEPLRHYAEAHLLMEPGKPGSGLQITSQCREEILPHQWQSQILAALQAKEHRGVLIGAPLTDVKITLVGGKGNIKHTSGGDFREATWRAVRQGLMMLKQVGQTQLLEPWYQFSLVIPVSQVGRALNDIQKMGGRLKLPTNLPSGEVPVRLTGEAPVDKLQDYPTIVRGYTHGLGQLTVQFGGFRPAEDQTTIIENQTYDPVSDLPNTPDSVFCAHGAGYPVKWDQVPQTMHCDYYCPQVMVNLGQN